LARPEAPLLDIKALNGSVERQIEESAPVFVKRTRAGGWGRRSRISHFPQVSRGSLVTVGISTPFECVVNAAAVAPLTVPGQRW